MNIYYPIGTIVKLTLDEEMLFMISGYMVRQADEKTHDYMAVPFPFGLVKSDQYVIFNRKCIVEVVHKGYCDEECQQVLDGLDQFVENLNKITEI